MLERQNLGLSVNVKAKQVEEGPDPNYYYMSAVVEIPFITIFFMKFGLP
jgi:hypothetical protein